MVLPLNVNEFIMIKIILPAAEIPDGSIVTKRTGSKQYTLQSVIKYYDLEGKCREIKTEDSVKLLISDNGSINAVSPETELVWETTFDDLQYMYEEDK